MKWHAPSCVSSAQNTFPPPKRTPSRRLHAIWAWHGMAASQLRFFSVDSARSLCNARAFAIHRFRRLADISIISSAHSSVCLIKSANYHLRDSIFLCASKERSTPCAGERRAESAECGSALMSNIVFLSLFPPRICDTYV